MKLLRTSVRRGILAALATLPVMVHADDAQAARKPAPARSAAAAMEPRVRFGFVDSVRLQAESPGLMAARQRIEAEQFRYDQELREGQRRIAAIDADIASVDVRVASLSAEASGDPVVRQKAFEEREALDDRRYALADEVGGRMSARREALDEARRALEQEILRIRGVLADLARQRRLEGVLDGRHAFFGAVDLTADMLRLLGATGSTVPVTPPATP
ncbi:MAG: OmpH family outer membrane protein [Candidatus Sericytochromatia bacterium]|nr:OmpH family outer membrane protein [Candidatus Sericytochromatia bacterium]